MEKIKSIFFVCTGNTCRSPMAEGLFKNKYNQDEVFIASRGLMVFNESPPNDLAIEVMLEKGVDISKHRSLPFDKEEVNGQTLVLTMTKRHKTVLKQHGYQGHVFSLKEFVGLDGDVDDPYGGDLVTYRMCANELEEIIEKTIERLGGNVE